MELLCVFPLMIVIYVVMQLQKQQPTQNNQLTEDQKYMAAIALDKLAHGDENWTHPWEL